jgi:Zn-dependent oligopeptidase
VNFAIRSLSLFAIVVTAASTAASASAAVPASGGPTFVEWSLSPARIASTCRAAIGKARRAVATLSERPAPWTFENTTEKLEAIGANLNDELVAQTFLNEVAPDAKVRSASLDCSNDVSSFSTDETAIPALYRRIAAADRTVRKRSDADRALSRLWLQSFARSGAGLSSAKRAEFVRLSKSLNDLELRFGKNIADDKSEIALTTAQAAGLPADFVGTLKKSDAGYVVPVNDSTAQTFLSNASDAGARKTYYLAYENIASPANVGLLERAIAIRSRLARLMGFPSWAAYQLDVRVDRSPQHIAAFLADLDAKLLPRARENVAELATIKAKETDTARASIDAWDVKYYLNELDYAIFAVDQEDIKRYFPAAHTVDAILSIYQHLLGVTFAPIPGAGAWQSDVTEYAVTDTASGRYLGSFYLDLYARVGKQGGAFNAPILPVRRMPDGSFRSPLCAIVVNDWPAATPGKPVLLTHEDVTTFFHEFEGRRGGRRRDRGNVYVQGSGCKIRECWRERVSRRTNLQRR